MKRYFYFTLWILISCDKSDETNFFCKKNDFNLIECESKKNGDTILVFNENRLGQIIIKGKYRNYDVRLYEGTSNIRLVNTSKPNDPFIVNFVFRYNERVFSSFNEMLNEKISIVYQENGYSKVDVYSYFKKFRRDYLFYNLNIDHNGLIDYDYFFYELDERRNMYLFHTDLNAFNHVKQTQKDSIVLYYKYVTNFEDSNFEVKNNQLRLKEGDLIKAKDQFEVNIVPGKDIIGEYRVYIDLDGKKEIFYYPVYFTGNLIKRISFLREYLKNSEIKFDKKYITNKDLKTFDKYVKIVDGKIILSNEFEEILKAL